MGRRASRWPAILTGPEPILGAHWPSLFRIVPRPVRQALLAVGRHAPGRSVRWGNLRRLRPFSNRYGNLLACVATLWGRSVQGLSTEELAGKHPCFLPVACAHADKPA